jgi:hypothetical protein
MSGVSWRTQRSELVRELAAGAMIVAMTNESAPAGDHACTVTIYTEDERLVHYAATEDLLTGICSCSNTEMR